MRDGIQRDNKLLEEGGQLYGFSLAADYCAEHECGIADLRRLLGATPAPVLKFEDNVCKKGFDSYRYGSYKGCDYLYVESNFNLTYFDKKPGDYLKRIALYYSDDSIPFAAAWNDKGFCIKAFSDEAKALLKDLVNAFESGDVAISLGGGHVFRNSGLQVAIVSRIPQHLINTANEAYEDAKKLRDAAEATGIRERLHTAGRNFYALSPRWNSDTSTKYPVVFWLNPYDQKNNNFGWFSVEELDQWIDGKGPVPKKVA